MVIEWAGGGTSRMRLAFLRQQCPCATCSEKRDQEAAEAGLHVLTDSDLGTTDAVTGVEPVGRYAIRIRWADGHDTGIYTYDTLRRLAGEAPGKTEA
jgi:DUF971 family protein